MKPIDVEEIRKMARDLSATAASPEFLNLIRRVHEAEDSDKLKTATQVARVETLVEHGVSLPQSFRITTREFEEPDGLQAKFAEGLPHIMYDGDRVVFTLGGEVIIVEAMHEHD